VAALLGIEAEGIDARTPIQIVSSGVPFVFIPITDLATMRRLRIQMDVWEREFKTAPEFFVFTRETDQPGSMVHCRMFGPAMGITEDPATGAAHGPMGAYLARYGIITDSPATLVNEQGFEMGRPSLITVIVEHSGGEIRRVRVGGKTRFVGEGYLLG
jgi:trans-2,3-dihydro-3-hydroxyanthranilate isomerase